MYLPYWTITGKPFRAIRSDLPFKPQPREKHGISKSLSRTKKSRVPPSWCCGILGPPSHPRQGPVLLSHYIQAHCALLTEATWNTVVTAEGFSLSESWSRSITLIVLLPALLAHVETDFEWFSWHQTEMKHQLSFFYGVHELIRDTEEVLC